MKVVYGVVCDSFPLEGRVVPSTWRDYLAWVYGMANSKTNSWKAWLYVCIHSRVSDWCLRHCSNHEVVSCWYIVTCLPSNVSPCLENNGKQLFSLEKEGDWVRLKLRKQCLALLCAAVWMFCCFAFFSPTSQFRMFLLLFLLCVHVHRHPCTHM